MDVDLADVDPERVEGDDHVVAVLVPLGRREACDPVLPSTLGGPSRTGVCWAFSFLSMVIATPASRTFTLVFALMLGVALGRRRFIDPRRQHFQVDQFVEFKRRVSHECFLPQAANKTSA